MKDLKYVRLDLTNSKEGMLSVSMEVISYVKLILWTVLLRLHNISYNVSMVNFNNVVSMDILVVLLDKKWGVIFKDLLLTIPVLPSFQKY